MLLTFFVTLSLCLAEVCLQNILQQDSCYNRRWTAQQQQISDLQTLVKQYVVSQQSNQEEPDIAFYARLSGLRILERHEDLKFDSVVTNQGSAYNKTSGHFVAPFHGLYQFSVSALSRGVNGSSDMGFDVMRNWIIVGNLWCHYTAAVVLNLVLFPKDEVWVRKDFDSKLEAVERTWTSFSGHLIRQYK